MYNERKKTRIQTRIHQYNVHISRPKQEKENSKTKRLLKKKETMEFQGTPFAKQTQNTHKTHIDSTANSYYHKHIHAKQHTSKPPFIACKTNKFLTTKISSISPNK